MPSLSFEKSRGAALYVQSFGLKSVAAVMSSLLTSGFPTQGSFFVGRKLKVIAMWHEKHLEEMEALKEAEEKAKQEALQEIPEGNKP